ncbi:MAG: STT3 domain-containing protein, partial [Nanoarchaeota archaeon]
MDLDSGSSAVTASAADAVVERRKQKILQFLKQKGQWLTYVFLAVIVYISVWIRTRNVPGLKDVTTGTWTLGPDLDPFLFLRWAKYIVENGSLFAVDMMRYVPKGFETTGEYLLHPYMIAWFHNIFSGIFSWTVTQSAIYYPVFMFALTVIAFFLFVRKAFYSFTSTGKANAIALVASFFLSVMPTFLPRTIAGIPEKESAAFFFLFMTFYLFITSWESKSKIQRYLTSAIAGVSTAAMSFVWGGYVFIFFILSPAVIISFLIGNADRKKIYSFVLWMVVSFFMMLFLSEQYPLRTILASFSTGSALMATFIMLAYEFVYKKYLADYFSKQNNFLAKIPPRLLSIVLSIIALLILVVVFLGPDTLTGNISEIYFQLVKPAQTRLITTVAENRQPYFNEWASNFGPNFKNILIGFWIFFIGSVALVYKVLEQVFDKRETRWLTAAYLYFLISVVFSRYAPGKVFDGENTISLLFYASGIIVFTFVFCLFYYRNYKRGEMSKFENVPLGIVSLLIFFFLAIAGARGLVRLVMVLVPPASVIIGYVAVSSATHISKVYKKQAKSSTIIFSVAIVVAVLFTGYSMYDVSVGSAQSYTPSSYTHQWQKAMGWVRENTPQNAV